METLAAILGIISSYLTINHFAAERAAEHCYYSGLLTNKNYQKYKWPIRALFISRSGITGAIFLREFELQFYKLVREYGDN